MIDPDRQKSQFEARLKRISAGGANTMGQVYVGPAEDSERFGKKRRAVSVLPSPRETIGYPLSIVGAILIGMLAVLISRWARYTISGGSLTGEDPDIMMAIDAGLALAIGFVLKQIFRLTGKVQETSKTIGIFAMVCIMHNFVHVWPGAFEMAFSPEWVTDVIETTQANSILFRGVSFVVGESAQNAPAMPQLIELNYD
jgi:hypothetical protein